jgi:hypothetical protein
VATSPLLLCEGEYTENFDVFLHEKSSQDSLRYTPQTSLYKHATMQTIYAHYKVFKMNYVCQNISITGAAARRAYAS